MTFPTPEAPRLSGSALATFVLLATNGTARRLATSVANIAVVKVFGTPKRISNVWMQIINYVFTH